MEERQAISIQYLVLPDPKRPDRSCKPKEIIDRLMKSGALELSLDTITAKTPIGEVEGNCHEVAMTMMIDLIRAENHKGWVWLTGYKLGGKKDGSNWEHSWLEYDGWAIDASNNHERIPVEGVPILIYDASWYRKAYKLKVTKCRNAKQTIKLIRKRHLKKGGK